jgi:hypothetical protein
VALRGFNFRIADHTGVEPLFYTVPIITTDQRKLMALTQLLIFLGRPSRVLVLRSTA